jgi:hypothetical protein
MFKQLISPFFTRIFINGPIIIIFINNSKILNLIIINHIFKDINQPYSFIKVNNFKFNNLLLYLINLYKNKLEKNEKELFNEVYQLVKIK